MNITNTKTVLLMPDLPNNFEIRDIALRISKDKNTMQDFWHQLKEKQFLSIENKYNEFRELLMNMNLIKIDQNRNTIATDFALENKYFLIRAYNSSKNKYQYYISDLGKKFIINNLQNTNK